MHEYLQKSAPDIHPAMCIVCLGYMSWWSCTAVTRRPAAHDKQRLARAGWDQGTSNGTTPGMWMAKLAEPCQASAAQLLRIDRRLAGRVHFQHCCAICRLGNGHVALRSGLYGRCRWCSNILHGMSQMQAANHNSGDECDLWHSSCRFLPSLLFHCCHTAFVSLLSQPRISVTFHLRMLVSSMSLSTSAAQLGLEALPERHLLQHCGSADPKRYFARCSNHQFRLLWPT